MLPIQQDYDLDFLKDMVKDKYLSRIYGFILYTRKNPYVVKVLRDDDFWNSLNDISGANWPIFAVKPHEQNHHVSRSYSVPGALGFMVQTGVTLELNTKFLIDFGLSDYEDLPCFVAFMWDDNDNLQSITVPIRGNDISTVYSSIETIVRLISETESKILPEYKQNVEVFRNVSDQLKALEFKHDFKKSVCIGRKIIEFLKLF